MKSTGKVFLVGGGPGDPGLLTVKGRAVLERADCVVCDLLANEDLLKLVPLGCEKILAGKRGSHRSTPQPEINSLLMAKAREGKTVVRLKGGDPFVFARGGEEAEALAAAGIPFEIVPGVSSGVAAAAYAGIPITHRDFASCVTFVTGHEDPGKEGTAVDWSNLAAIPGTLVFFMSMKRVNEITAALVEHGRSPFTPAAAIRWGTLPRQQVVTGTLEDLAIRAGALQPPAVIVVGDVVKLREKIIWYERLPLFGKRIVITRAREQAGGLVGMLTDLGAEVIEFPTIEIRDAASWGPLDGAIRRLEEFQYLLVTSVNGVARFLLRLQTCGRDVRDLKGIQIGAIGPATAAEFARTGVRVDFIPKEYRAEGLLEALKSHELKGKAFLIPRAKVARDLVPRALVERGARVEVVEAYETVAPALVKERLEKAFNPRPDVVTFTSSATASNFAKAVGPNVAYRMLEGVAVASIGEVSSNTLRGLGLHVDLEAKESTMQGLIEAIRNHFSRSG